ncbi:tetratricopeptide repeat protein [Myxococcota bacterium]|nr:tetratricopeptide repeat protein [Myxococcota bacterium]
MAARSLTSLTLGACVVLALASPPFALAEPPPAAVAARDEGLKLSKENMHEQAAEALQRAVKLDPGFAEAWADLGNTYIVMGSMKDAIAAFESAVRIRPDMQTARYNLAFALRKTASHKRAAEQYRLYLQRDPEDADACYGLAESLKAQGDALAAAEAYERYAAVEKRPSQEKWIEKAKVQAKELRAGVAAKEAAMKAELAATKTRDATPASASTTLTDGAKGSTTELGLTAIPSTNARKTNVTPEQLDEARARSEGGATVGGGDRGASVGRRSPALDRALASLKRHDFAAARKDAELASKDAPDDAIVLSALAAAQLGDGRAADAEVTYRRAITAAKPEALPALYFGLGEALRAQGEKAAAKDAYAKASTATGATAALKALATERTKAL